MEAIGEGFLNLVRASERLSGRKPLLEDNRHWDEAHHLRPPGRNVNGEQSRPLRQTGAGGGAERMPQRRVAFGCRPAAAAQEGREHHEMPPVAALKRNAGQTLVSLPPVMAKTERMVFADHIDHLAGVLEERRPVLIPMLAEPAEGKQIDAFFVTEFPEQLHKTPVGDGVEIEPGIFGCLDDEGSGFSVAGISNRFPEFRPGDRVLRSVARPSLSG